MALADLLGLGGQSEMFTNWRVARDFVQNKIINQNPRISSDTKNQLLALEEQKFEMYNGQWLASEREEIAQYWAALKNDVPSITNDQGILDILNAGQDAATDVADPNKAADINIADVAISTGATLSTTALIGLGLIAYFVFKGK